MIAVLNNAEASMKRCDIPATHAADVAAEGCASLE
jgi:hypothetical protein